MKGISPFIAAIILIGLVIAAFGLLSPLLLDITKSKEAAVESEASASMECRMGILHVESFSVNGNVKVTIENLGETELSGLKIVAYNETGSFTYDATPSSLSMGSKVTLTSSSPGGNVWKVMVLTRCSNIYDEKVQES